MIDHAERVERLRGSRPRIIRMIAPAGYGKSVLARELGKHFPTSATCDCAGVRDVTDFAQRTVVALAREDAARADPLAQATLSAGDEASWRELAHHAWGLPGERSLFVFENAHAIGHDARATELLAELLGARQDFRTVVLCSRTALSVPFSRIAAPHEISTIGTGALRLRYDEIEAAFADVGLSAATLARVADISDGWAVAVFLLARFAREGRLEAMLDKLDDVAFDELHEYLMNEVLAHLDPAVFEALLACVAIPNARPVDVAVALGIGDAEPVLRDLAQALPFVSRVRGGSYEVSPLQATLLRSRHEERCRSLVSSTAQAWLERGEYIRAAQLWLHLGDRAAAAAAADRTEAPYLSLPSIEFADIVAGLDDATLLKHPHLWGSAMILRVASIEPREWVRQAAAIWNALPADASPTIRGPIAGAYFSALTNVGRVDEAQRLVEELERSLNPGDENTRTVYELLRIAIDIGYRGRYADAEATASRLYPMLARSDVTHAYFLSQALCYVYAARGEFDLGRQAFERAIELALRTNVALVKVTVLAHAVAFDWLAGDDALFESHLRLLEESIDPSAAKAAAFLVECARGRAKEARIGFEKLERRTFAYLIAAGQTPSGDDAARFARQAVRSADESSQPFLQVLARVCLGELAIPERRKLLKDAGDFAAGLESIPLQDAVAALRNGARDAGMLTAFVARFRKPGSAVEDRAAAGGASKAPSPLTKREREVALLVAAGRSNREIAQALFISERTVENHIASMFNKLGIGSRAALAAHVAREGGNG